MVLTTAYIIYFDVCKCFSVVSSVLKIAVPEHDKITRGAYSLILLTKGRTIARQTSTIRDNYQQRVDVLHLSSG
jgi:hypothetical protein